MRTAEGVINADDVIARLSPTAWDNEAVSFDFRRGTHGSALVVGCYELEDFGVWSMTPNPSVILPMTVSGEFVLTIEARAFKSNVGREIRLEIGDCARTARFDDVPTTVDLLFKVSSPSHVLKISGIDAKSDPTADDPRSLGIGLSKFSFRRLPDQGTAGVEVPSEVDLSNSSTNQDHLVGFHPAEPWGSWTAHDVAWIGSARVVPGKVAVRIEYMSHSGNAGRTLKIRVADVAVTLPISDEWEVVDFELAPTIEGHVFEIEGWIPDLNPGTGDPRKLGVGIRRLAVHQREVAPLPKKRNSSRRHKRSRRRRPRLSRSIPVSRKVFLSDISGLSEGSIAVDVISAFLWAFRQDPEAMLIVVSSSHAITEDLANVLFLLSRVGEIKCRVIVVPVDSPHGAPNQLLRAADVFVAVTSDQVTAGFARDRVRKDRRVVLSIPKAEEALAQRKGAVYVPMLLRPEKIYAERFGFRRKMVNALDWGRLATSLRDEGQYLDRKEWAG